MGTLTENKQFASDNSREETRLAWLALAMSPGLGPKRIADAVRQVEAPIDILSLPLTALEGLRFPAEAAQFIFDGKARTAAEAELKRVAAEDAAIQARKTATNATRRAWDLAEGARRSFLLLDSSIAAAEENLRVQRVSFDEGEATVTAVLGAQAALATARAQRIATAYEYDLALAGLLASAGELGQFDSYLANADIHVAPEPAR